MVWFQCEDCGENLKKPKLQNHFRMCSANKLSCIDCGYTFNQQSVQGHTQCVSEVEKYGPKGEVRASNGSTAKGKTDKSQNCDVDLSVGLSTRLPWVCSLCNVKTTSRETLLLHSEGKKHKSKARAFQASNESSKAVKPSQNGNVSGDQQNEEKHKQVKEVKVIDALDAGNHIHHKRSKQEEVKLSAVNGKKEGSELVNSPEVDEKHSKKRKRKEDKSSSSHVINVKNQPGQWAPDSNNGDMVHTRDLLLAKEGNTSKKKKRDKIDPLGVSNANNQIDQAGRKKVFDIWNGLENENVHMLDDARQSKETTEKENKLSDKKIVRSTLDDGQRETDNTVDDADESAKEISKLPVKWKKLIKSVLELSPNGALRMKKLQKAVLPLAMKALEAAGISADESHVRNELMHKVHFSSRFIVEGKTVRLA